MKNIENSIIKKNAEERKEELGFGGHLRLPFSFFIWFLFILSENVCPNFVVFDS